MPSTRSLRPSRPLLAATAALLAMMLLPARSTAGVYHVYSCRIPYGPLAGEAAPVASSEDEIGWSHSVVGNAQYSDLCSSHGAFTAALPAGVTHSDADLATWQFAAVTGQKITQATVWVAGNAAGGTGYLFWLASPANPSVKAATSGEDFVSGCVYTLGCRGVGTTSEPLAAANKVAVPAEDLGGSHLYINASCSSASCPSNSGDEQGHAVVVYVYATDIALEQQSSPTVSDLTGELAEDEELGGTASLFFTASDTGSGVYKEIVSVDGEVLESPVIDESELCKEVPVPAEDGPAFLSAQPCPGQANGRVSLDTERLSNGIHHVLVEVTDAAGNATTVLSKTIKVANGAPASGGGPSGGQTKATEERQTSTAESQGASAVTQPSGGAAAGAGATAPSNGTPASAHPTLVASWVAARGSQIGGASKLQLTGDIDHAESIAGRLTGPAGEAISGAAIDLSAREGVAGASATPLGEAKTGSHGRFVFHLSKQSPSEQIDLSYSPTVGGGPVVSKVLRLRVRAGVELHVTPATVSEGGTIHLQGRILGAKIPPGGKQIVLEARSQGSRWLQFLVLRSGESGRFEGAHRFRLPGPVRYWFRAVCPEEADFPFLKGESNQVTVWEQ